MLEKKIKVEPGQFFIVLAERNTGKIVNASGERVIGEPLPYFVFDNLLEAEAYASQKVT